MTDLERIKIGGAIPSPEDDRDYNIATVTASLPEEYEPKETDILNQGVIGSCVAHALVAGLEHGELINDGKYNDYSRGYIYGNRKDTDTQGEGMIIRQALKQLNHCGDVLYEDFPYNLTYPKVKELIEKDKDNLAEKALPHAITNYYRCYTENEIKQTVITNGCAIICIPVYSDFDKDVHVTTTKELEGYHAMAIVGWTKDYWIVQNSWGKSWGYNGYAHIYYDYPINEAWGITVNSGKVEPEKDNIIVRIIKLIIALLKKIFK